MPGAVPHRDRPCTHLLVPHHQGVGHLHELGSPDLLLDGLPALVHLRPQSALAEPRCQVPGRLGVTVGHGHDPNLLRREPQRERARVVLDQHPGEPLDGPQDGPVDHHRPVALVVLAHVLHVEPLG